jgi:tricorn protease
VGPDWDIFMQVSVFNTRRRNNANMSRSRIISHLGAVFSLAIFIQHLSAQTVPNAGMMRFPDVSKDSIVFVYGEDLWTVPRSGGTASLLAAPLGEESVPRFSPDGSTVAFVGNYDGNQDIYTVPLAGGPASRVTYHPASELLCDWTPDGKLIFSSNGFAGLGRQPQLFIQGPNDPLESDVPVPYGTNGTISADGKWLAYTPHGSDYRTWKRYRGGMASDIWLFNLDTKASKQMTDFEGTDTIPMWNGNVVYYLSDAGPDHRLNIWMYNTETEERRQVTNFTDNDCRWPANGPGPEGKGEIVFQNGEMLHLLDLATNKTTPVSISIPGDRPKLRPNRVDASKFIVNADLSPNAKRVVVEARGDLWTLPAKNGTPRNLTQTSGTAERMPAWSLDGRWLAYFSDATGEYELCIIQSDGVGEPKQLTKDGNCYRYAPTWSPDSKRITFTDKTGGLFVHSLETQETKQIDRDPTSAQVNVTWSHDSRWIAYARAEDNRSSTNALWVFNVENGTKQKVTAGFFNDASPVFDRGGDFLYFVSSRSFTSPKYEDLGTTFIYSDTQVVMAMPLRPDVKNPLAPKSDEESWKDESKSGDSAKEDFGKNGAEKPTATSDETKQKPADAAAKKDEKKESPPLQIDFDQLEARAFVLPVKPGAISNIVVNNKGQLIYGRVESGGRGGDDAGGPRQTLKLFDMTEDDPKEKDVVANVQGFGISADGTKLLVIKGPSEAFICDAAAGQKLESAVVTKGMEVEIDRRAEWKQVLKESWRVQRDFFYDPTMHGVDWQKIGDHYAAMLDDCASRRDVSFLIKEMISELNVGHAYYREGDVENPESVNVGLPGCRFELADGAYRIQEIFQGAAWDVDARNSLIGAGVKVGDYVLAVNGISLSTSKSPYQAFIGKAGMVVSMTVSVDTKLDDQDKKVVIKLRGNDDDLRFRQWIEANRRYVDEKSGGKIGYIYVVNTGVPGQNDLVRMLYGQLHKDALIIDDRWNGGGQIPTRFIELLNRPATNAWARRDGRDWIWPPDAHQGPKCMLINGMAGSGGDMFPALFKQNKLGPLIGMRTWGGLVGISGGPTNIDGSSVTAPTFAYYDLDGTWGIEGHGVDPDLRVVDDPAKMQNGGDPQLDVAIEEMLKALKDGQGFQPPQRPAYPNRSKMGIKPEDK